MSFLSAKPSDTLSPFISQYWMIENCMQHGDSHIQRIVPSGLMEMSFYLGDKPKIVALNQVLPANALLSGQINKHYDLLVPGNLSMFSVTFKPQGAKVFFDLPLIELADQNIPLRFILKESADKIESELFEAKTFVGKVIAIENFLIQQLRNNFTKHMAIRIDDSIALINSTQGKISIEELASHACLSNKQYGRIFKNYIGISPKRFLRIVRFQHAIYNKQLNPNISLTKLSYNCGYFDQSHMINDFKELSGKVPKLYFSECEQAYSDYFSM